MRENGKNVLKDNNCECSDAYFMWRKRWPRDPCWYCLAWEDAVSPCASSFDTFTTRTSKFTNEPSAPQWRGIPVTCARKGQRGQTERDSYKGVIHFCRSGVKFSFTTNMTVIQASQGSICMHSHVAPPHPHQQTLYDIYLQVQWNNTDSW